MVRHAVKKTKEGIPTQLAWPLPYHAGFDTLFFLGLALNVVKGSL